MQTSSFNTTNILLVRSRFAARWNTAAANAARKVHPVSQLSIELANELKAHQNSLSAFNLFKNRLYEVSQSLQDTRFTLQRSFGLNSVLVQLLQASRKDLNNPSENDSQLPPNPYEILCLMCEYGLARDSHFQIVFEHLIALNAPQDVLGLWVKYLETLAENPKMVISTYANHHANNLALASIGYLMLPGNSPNLAELAQVLNLGEKTEQLPLPRIRYIIDTLNMDSVTRKNAKERFSRLVLEFSQTCKLEFEKQLQRLDQVQDVQNLFQGLKTAAQASGQQLSTDTFATFMNKFIELNKPQQAIAAFNTAKEAGILDISLKNALLVAVANIPVYGRDVREQKIKRIEAVWNTYILTSSGAIGVDSYIALVTALGESRNFQHMQQLWNNEIPIALKSDQSLTEAYLLFQSYRKNFSLEGIQSQLPEKIGSIKLANQVLLKMIEERRLEADINQFYRKHFSDPDAPLKADDTTLALKMYSNYTYTKDAEFQFMRSISKSKNDVRATSAIFKKFSEICPDIEVTRALFNEIQTPLDAKKYGYMITAESKAGNINACEDIFKRFAQDTKSMNNITRSILDPIIDAVCEQCIQDKSAAKLEKINIYATFAKRAQKSLSFAAASRILHTLAILSKTMHGGFTTQQNDILMALLQDIHSMKNFTPSKRDIDVLIQNKISVPKSTL
ncbi:LADA_0F08152g1_1 [Lachancea dasiensis]|uniref:LADA_0F08152g1_1 n=1 Tax=Lachancea dasiensis TaxID=1072105 RepID=A0A1G4JKL0_9SACH|nr:LADA_0F08152g1_1 [Lachancea dasiensis]